MNKTTIILISAIIILLFAIGLFVIFWGGEPAIEDGLITGVFPGAGGRDIEGLTPVEEGTVVIKGKNLAQLSSSPVAGAIFAAKTLGVEKGKVRYVERKTGNVYEINPDGKERTRLSNTTIPKVFDVVWSRSGDSFILRYFSDSNEQEIIRNFSAELADGEENDSLKETQGSFLPSEITAFASAPDRDRLFYLFDSANRTIGSVADFDNENQNQIFSSPFSEWTVSWPNKNLISFLTKPSGSANGFLYSLDPFTTSFKKVLGEIRGLTVLWNPNGKSFIYSKSANNSFTTWLSESQVGESAQFVFATLPEKCVFSSKGESVYCAVPENISSALYPDEWYQGIISFSDSVWKTDIKSGNTELLLDNSNGFDIINLFLSKDKEEEENEEYLFFTNKKDSTLWSLKLDK